MFSCTIPLSNRYLKLVNSISISRVLRIDIEIEQENYTLITRYGQNEGAKRETVDEFWDDIQNEVEKKNEILILAEDFN